MKPYLDLDAFTYDGLGDFIQSAAYEADASFLLGKAAAYVDVAFALDLIPRAEAEELLLCVQVYRGM